jgi:predicted nicotinamide N-methyase
MADDSTPWRPSLLGWKSRFAEDYVLRLSAQDSVRVSQAPSSASVSDFDPGVTGTCVWDGAVVLASYLRQEHVWAALQRRLGSLYTVLELGAGTGLVSACFAAPGSPLPTSARLVATDLPPLLPLLSRNVRAYPSVAVAALRWGSQDDATAALGSSQACLVLGADVCYRQPNVDPLLLALEQTLRPGGCAVFALDESHCPEAVADFRRRAGQSYELRQVREEEMHPRHRCPEVLLLELWRPMRDDDVAA